MTTYELTDFPVSYYTTSVLPDFPFGRKIMFLSGYVLANKGFLSDDWGFAGEHFNDWDRGEVEFVIGPEWKSINANDIVPRVTASVIWAYPLGGGFPHPSVAGKMDLFGWGVDSCRADIKHNKIRLTCSLATVCVCEDCSRAAFGTLDKFSHEWVGIIRLNYNVTAVGHIEGPEGEYKPPVLKLCYVKLTSLNTPVMASGDDGNVPSNVVDGDIGTRWSNKGIGQWIRVDLGQIKEICRVEIAWYKGDTRSYHFVISTSDDDSIYNEVFKGDSSGTTLNIEKYVTKHTKTRFVKVTVNGSTDPDPNLATWASITELIVMGTGQ